MSELAIFSSLNVHNTEHLCGIVFLVLIKGRLTIGEKELTNKETSKLTSKETSKLTSKETGKQTRKQIKKTGNRINKKT